MTWQDFLEKSRWYQSTEEEEDSHREYAMQLVSASVLPMVLKAALELGVLDIIGRAGPGALLSPSEIASHIPTHNPDAPFALDRILRLWLAIPFLLTLLTPTVMARSIGSMDKVTVDIWHHLKDAVLEGGLPFKRSYGMDAIDYVGKDARSKIIGGRGWRQRQCPQFHRFQGIEHVAGDMFTSVPKGDAIFMKNILHSWSDEHCVKLLRNATMHYQTMEKSLWWMR
ncbi:Caffeic acid 3-O-methyltransferase [Vitis vinifera]|uniref:Caffeic acid 3-O-methyltransferase n=1 Tax=Vitis vinifera TaxID=29760 RepID=A0A438BV90_VITVI|nr:Caffeic acid 3-O-methyltransferase [Vitis vinifera]